MNGRWWWALFIEVLCSVGAVYDVVRAAIDFASLHLMWAVIWSALAALNTWAARSSRRDRRRIEAELDGVTR